MNLARVKVKGLLHGLLLGAGVPENAELTPVSSGSGLIYTANMLQVHQLPHGDSPLVL